MENRWPVLAVVYEDDFRVFGENDSAKAMFEKLKDKNEGVGFSDDDLYQNEEVIDLERYDTVDENGFPALIVHQTAYCQYIFEQFEARHGRLRCYDTQLEAREERGQAGEVEEPEAAIPSFVPTLESEKEEHGGKLIWLYKGSRIDLGVAQHRVTSRYTTWTRREDKMLSRIYSYLKMHPNFGVMLRVDPAEASRILVNLRTDSDLANDIPTSKSTGGQISMFRDPRHTYAPVEWHCRQTLATGRSTAEVETVSLDRGIFGSALPLVGIAEQVL